MKFWRHRAILEGLFRRREISGARRDPRTCERKALREFPNLHVATGRDFINARHRMKHNGAPQALLIRAGFASNSCHGLTADGVARRLTPLVRDLP
jgi:hypothetical protein